MPAQPLLRFLVRRNANYFVDAVFRALLGREADAAALAAYGNQLRNTGDLAAVTRSIARSDEAWDAVFYGGATRIIGQVFRGILGRDPEATALAAYTDFLSARKELAAFLAIVCESEEHWDKLVADRAEDIVRATFLGILNRAPDAEGLSVYCAHLRQHRDLASLFTIIASSDEHWHNLLQVKRASGQLLRADHLPSLLAEVVNSPKTWNELSALKFPSAAAASSALDTEAWVFLHVQKTGGTSLQNMFAETLGDGNVYREHADTLYMRSPAELSAYCVFAGHFNHDSVAFIPRRRKHLVTILREPKQRLLSLYRFLRAHEPSAPGFNGGIEIANHLGVADFFQSILAASASETWNHMTWTVMGQRRWEAYKERLSGLSGEALGREQELIRGDFRQRLEEFSFIGFQEDFNYSSQRLFELVGARLPKLRHDHSVEMLASNLDHFKFVAEHPLTPELDAVLEPLIILDNVLYREACDIYYLRNGRVNAHGTFHAV